MKAIPMLSQSFWPWNRHKYNAADRRVCWGYAFYLTPEHMSVEESDRLKQSCDRLADRAYAILSKLTSQSCSCTQPATIPDVTARSDVLIADKVLPFDSQTNHADYEKPKVKRDLYALLRDNAAEDPVLNELWIQVNTVPEWVDWETIARGQEVFYRYGGPAFMGLAFQSLLGGMAAGRVVETLTRTGGFSTRVARHRLFETTQHILQCTKSLESLQPGGDGFASSIRVRLLHAAVRTSIMQLAAAHPEYYDASTLGIPINDLDCIGTILTFSSSLIWIAFPRQGIYVTKQEAEDYIALWRYVAYLTGTPTHYFETPEKARRAMETLMLYEMTPTETSKILAHNVIECLAMQPPSYLSREYLEAFARWLNGDALCDALGLGRPGWYYWSLVAGQVMFSMFMSYTTRAFRRLDRKKIALLRKVLWNVIVESKDGLGMVTLFDYKYIPRLGKSTKPSKGIKHEKVHRRIERRNFMVFVAASLTMVSLGLTVLRILPSAAVLIRNSFIEPQYNS